MSLSGQLADDDDHREDDPQIILNGGAIKRLVIAIAHSKVNSVVLTQASFK